MVILGSMASISLADFAKSQCKAVGSGKAGKALIGLTRFSSLRKKIILMFLYTFYINVLVCLFYNYSFFDRRNSYRKGIQEHVKLSAAHAIVFMESLTMD